MPSPQSMFYTDQYVVVVVVEVVVGGGGGQLVSIE